MNIEINIDRQPVAARGVVARQISYREMWLKVRETADKLFVALQQATIDKESAIEALRSADEHITETQQALWAAQKECAGLRGELEAVKLEIIKLTANNKRLINDNLNEKMRASWAWDLYQTAASKPNAKEAEKTATTAKSEQTQDGSIFPVESSLPPVESFCGHCGDCANPTDETIDELLKRLDKIAGHYGRPYGLPMAHKGTKQLLIDAVRDWVSGK